MKKSNFNVKPESAKNEFHKNKIGIDKHRKSANPISIIAKKKLRDQTPSSNRQGQTDKSSLQQYKKFRKTGNLGNENRLRSQSDFHQDIHSQAFFTNKAKHVREDRNSDQNFNKEKMYSEENISAKKTKLIISPNNIQSCDLKDELKNSKENIHYKSKGNERIDLSISNISIVNGNIVSSDEGKEKLNCTPKKNELNNSKLFISSRAIEEKKLDQLNSEFREGYNLDSKDLMKVEEQKESQERDEQIEKTESQNIAQKRKSNDKFINRNNDDLGRCKEKRLSQRAFINEDGENSSPHIDELIKLNLKKYREKMEIEQLKQFQKEEKIKITKENLLKLNMQIKRTNQKYTKKSYIRSNYISVNDSIRNELKNISLINKKCYIRLKKNKPSERGSDEKLISSPKNPNSSYSNRREMLGLEFVDMNKKIKGKLQLNKKEKKNKNHKKIERIQPEEKEKEQEIVQLLTNKGKVDIWIEEKKTSKRIDNQREQEIREYMKNKRLRILSEKYKQQKKVDDDMVQKKLKLKSLDKFIEKQRNSEARKSFMKFKSTKIKKANKKEPNMIKKEDSDNIYQEYESILNVLKDQEKFVNFNIKKNIEKSKLDNSENPEGKNSQEFYNRSNKGNNEKQNIIFNIFSEDREEKKQIGLEPKINDANKISLLNSTGDNPIEHIRDNYNVNSLLNISPINECKSAKKCMISKGQEINFNTKNIENESTSKRDQYNSSIISQNNQKKFHGTSKSSERIISNVGEFSLRNDNDNSINEKNFRSNQINREKKKEEGNLKIENKYKNKYEKEKEKEKEKGNFLIESSSDKNLTKEKQKYTFSKKHEHLDLLKEEEIDKDRNKNNIDEDLFENTEGHLLELSLKNKLKLEMIDANIMTDNLHESQKAEILNYLDIEEKKSLNIEKNDVFDFKSKKQLEEEIVQTSEDYDPLINMKNKIADYEKKFIKEEIKLKQENEPNSQFSKGKGDENSILLGQKEQKYKNLIIKTGMENNKIGNKIHDNKISQINEDKEILGDIRAFFGSEKKIREAYSISLNEPSSPHTSKAVEKLNFELFKRSINSDRSAILNNDSIDNVIKDNFPGRGIEKGKQNIFDRNDFENFSFKKFKELLHEDNMSKILRVREQMLKFKEKKEKKIINKRLKRNEYSPKTYFRKRMELEKWISKEKEEIKKSKQQFVENWKKTAQLINEAHNNNLLTKKLVLNHKVSFMSETMSARSLLFDSIESKQNTEREIFNEDDQLLIQFNKKENIDLSKSSKNNSIDELSKILNINNIEKITVHQPDNDSAIKIEPNYEIEDDKPKKITGIKNNICEKDKDISNKFNERIFFETGKSEDSNNLNLNKIKSDQSLNENNEKNHKNNEIQNLDDFLLQRIESSKGKTNIDEGFIINTEKGQAQEENKSLKEGIISPKLQRDREDEFNQDKEINPNKELLILNENNKITRKTEDKEKEKDKLSNANEKISEQISNIILNQLVKEIKAELFPKRPIELINAIDLNSLIVEDFNSQTDGNQNLYSNLKDRPAYLNSSLDETNGPEDINNKLLKQSLSRKEGIKTDPIVVGNYLDDILIEVLKDSEKFLENLQKPIIHDQLKWLSNLQQPDLKCLIPQCLPHELSPILIRAVYLKIEKSKENNTSKVDVSDNSHSNLDQSNNSWQSEKRSKSGKDNNSMQSPTFLRKCEKIHNKAIFDSVNECLNLMRY